MVIQTDMKSKRVRNVLIGISALVILAAIGAGGLELYFRRVFGPGIDPRSSQGVQALVQIAGASRPLRDALERFKREHGSYPVDFTNLVPNYLPVTNASDDISDFAGWDYYPKESSSGYELMHQIDWDDLFGCECESNGARTWTCWTSTGDIDLTEKVGGI